MLDFSTNLDTNRIRHDNGTRIERSISVGDTVAPFTFKSTRNKKLQPLLRLLKLPNCSSIRFDLVHV